MEENSDEDLLRDLISECEYSSSSDSFVEDDGDLDEDSRAAIRGLIHPSDDVIRERKKFETAVASVGIGPNFFKSALLKGVVVEFGENEDAFAEKGRCDFCGCERTLKVRFDADGKKALLGSTCANSANLLICIGNAIESGDVNDRLYERLWAAWRRLRW